MNNYYPNSICFSPEHYESKQLPIDDMYYDINTFVKILLTTENIIVIRQEDFGNVVIEYAHDPQCEDYGELRPMWVDPAEEENIIYIRNTYNEDEDLK